MVKKITYHFLAMVCLLLLITVNQSAYAQGVGKVGGVDSSKIEKIMGVNFSEISAILGLSSESQSTDNQAWLPGTSWFDNRDSTHYRTVKIGQQTWMVDNLTFDPGVGTVRWYNDDSTTYSNFGRLYNHTAAMAGGRYSNTYPSVRQGACPIGWHLPSQLEYDTLFQRVDGNFSSGNSTCSTCGSLKDTSLVYWTSPNTGADSEFGLNIWGAEAIFPVLAIIKLRDIFGRRATTRATTPTTTTSGLFIITTM
ncbi:hypothetical protein KFE98_15905 [bacterium SCSIO 12741]|nr:hypothetical protein KFE98_15905 [bacterium SCSIO 12741]